ncbi:hypothetical protein LCGC14_0832310 [marine sediment metagenome]|uniref:Uncharacterized protein n=1 Tax=marine sediment metagenome TaxID=412755 RepID=A0A0F9Q0U1_9ZZZZ
MRLIPHSSFCGAARLTRACRRAIFLIRILRLKISTAPRTQSRPDTAPQCKFAGIRAAGDCNSPLCLGKRHGEDFFTDRACKRRSSATFLRRGCGIAACLRTPQRLGMDRREGCAALDAGSLLRRTSRSIAGRGTVFAFLALLVFKLFPAMRADSLRSLTFVSVPVTRSAQQLNIVDREQESDILGWPRINTMVSYKTVGVTTSLTGFVNFQTPCEADPTMPVVPGHTSPSWLVTASADAKTSLRAKLPVPIRYLPCTSREGFAADETYLLDCLPLRLGVARPRTEFCCSLGALECRSALFAHRFHDGQRVARFRQKG